MEFRFFFPVVHSSDDWISLPIKEEYENKLNIMKHYFLEKVNCPTSEKRVDSYYVGGPLVGVKLRAGKKMEIKLKRSDSILVPGAEAWMKEKLGKSHLHTYQAHIYELLDNYRIPRDIELFERNLIAEVSKERFSGVVAGADFEITFLQLHFSSPNDFPNRNWISICFEASESTLLALQRTPESPLLTYILPTLVSLLSITLMEPSISFSHRFYPVVSGYPAWLNSFYRSSLPPSTTVLSLLNSCHVPLALPSSSVTQDIVPTFNWSSHPELETPRLLLGEITLEHLNDIYQIRSNFEVTKYNIGKEYTEIQQAKNLIESMILDFSQKKALRWGIVKKDDPSQSVIGMIGFNYWNTTDHRGSVGFDLNHNEWGHGYMKESLLRILEFGFEAMKLNRIEAMASAENENSLQLLKKVGFVIEGIQREQYYEDGFYHDLTLLALLKRECPPYHCCGRSVVTPVGRTADTLEMLFLPRQVGSGKGNKVNEEDFIDTTTILIEKVNTVLVIANIHATIKSYSQLRLTAPVLFIRVFEAYFWKKIPGVNYSPQSIQDHERNIDLLLNEFRKMYGYESLQNITGIDIVGGKQSAIETILDIFYGIHAVVDKKPKTSRKMETEAEEKVTTKDEEKEFNAIIEQVSSLKDLQARVLATDIFSAENNNDEQKQRKSPKKKVRPSSAPSSRLMRPTMASSNGLQVLDQKPRPPSPPLTLQRPPSRGPAFGRSADLRPTSPSAKPPSQDPSFSYDSWSGRKIPIEILDTVQEKNLKRLLSKRHPEMLEPPPVKQKSKQRTGELISEYPGNRIAKSVEQYIQKMKLEREGPREEKKNPTIDIFSQPNSTLPIYQYLGPYDMLISIEHCHQCEQHSKVLRHQAIEYHQQAIDIFRTLLYSIYSLTMPVRVGIIKFQADLSLAQHNLNQPTTNLEKPSRIGAFEVQIAYKDQKNQIRVHLLHSKLSTQKWPSKNVIKKRLLSFVTSCNIPTISRDLIPSFLFSSATSDFSTEDVSYGNDSIEPYPIGLVPWNQMKVSSDEWTYPIHKENVTLHLTENNICQIFDFRLNSTTSPFSMGSVIHVSNILNSYGCYEKYHQICIVQQIHKRESKLLVKLKYLSTEIDVPFDDCTPVDKESSKGNPPKNIDFFTVLSSYYTSAQSLLSLNSALSSTSYSTITPPPTRSAINTGRSSIPYVYFVLFNLSLYLSGSENSTEPLSSNIQWKIMNPSDYSLPRQMDEEDEEQPMMMGNEDFYLTRESFYCQIYDLVWNALIEASKLGGDKNCQSLRIKTNISLSEVMRVGIQIDTSENVEGNDFFDIDLQLCYSEQLLDWACNRFGNKINITELLKLVRPQPPTRKRLISKSSSNMSSESEEIKNFGNSFSYQLEEEDGEENCSRIEATPIAPIDLKELTSTSEAIKNQLQIMTDEVHEEEEKIKESESEKQRILLSINSIVQDVIIDQGNAVQSTIEHSISSPGLVNIHQITSSLRMRIQQVCLHIAPPEPHTIEATEAGDYLQTSKYRRGVNKLFHAFQTFSTPRGNVTQDQEIELDKSQFNAALSKFGIQCNENELEVLWATLDVDGNTHISPPELLSFLHYNSQIGYRQLGEIWNTLQKCNQNEDDLETDVAEMLTLEKIEDEMFNKIQTSSNNSSTTAVIPAIEFFEILRNYKMYSLLKPGDTNILIAYFGNDISGKPITDSILSSSGNFSPRENEQHWSSYMIRFDDFFSWLQPVDFQKISKRITRFLTAIINREGGLGTELDSSEEVISGIPIHAVDPEKTGFIQRKLFQIYVDSMGLPLTNAEVRSLFRHYGESSDHSKMRYGKLKEMLECSSGGLNHKILPLIGGGSFRKLSTVSPPKGSIQKNTQHLTRIESSMDDNNDTGSNPPVEKEQDQDKTGNGEPSETNGLLRNDSSTLDLPFLTPLNSNLTLNMEPDVASQHYQTIAEAETENEIDKFDACNVQLRVSMIEFECPLFDTDNRYDFITFKMKRNHTEIPQIREIVLSQKHKHGVGKKFIDELDWDPIDILSKDESIQIYILAKDLTNLASLEFVPMNHLQIDPKISQTISLALPLPNSEEKLIVQIHCRIKDRNGPSGSEKMSRKKNVELKLDSAEIDINSSNDKIPAPPLSTVKSISQFDQEFNDLYQLQFSEDPDDANNLALLESDLSNTEFLEQFESPAQVATDVKELLI